MTEQEFLSKYAVTIGAGSNWWDKTVHRVFWARSFEQDHTAFGHRLCQDYLRLSCALHPQCKREAQRILSIEDAHGT